MGTAAGGGSRAALVYGLRKVEYVAWTVVSEDEVSKEAAPEQDRVTRLAPRHRIQREGLFKIQVGDADGPAVNLCRDLTATDAADHIIVVMSEVQLARDGVTDEDEV